MALLRDKLLCQDMTLGSGHEVPRSVIIILDTNTLLNDQEIIEQSKGKYLNDRVIHLYVPYIVFQELDNLKSKGTAKVKFKAQRSIKWIHSLLTNHDPYIFGQSFDTHLKFYESHKAEVS